MILADYLAAHPDALNQRIAFERVLIERAAKLGLLGGEGLNDLFCFRRVSGFHSCGLGRGCESHECEQNQSSADGRYDFLHFLPDKCGFGGPAACYETLLFSDARTKDSCCQSPGGGTGRRGRTPFSCCKVSCN